MSGRYEGIRCGDDLAGDPQGLQRSDEGNGAISEEADMFDPKVLAQCLLELLMERTAVGEDAAIPDLPEQGQEIIQRWKVGLGDKDGAIHRSSAE